MVREDCQDVEIILLRNPCTGKASRYLHAKHMNRIYEVLNFNEEPRSWFIEDMAYATGSLFLTTYFDPLFSALYYLQKNCAERCVPFDQATVDEKHMHTNVLEDLVSDDQLSMVSQWLLLKPRTYEHEQHCLTILFDFPQIGNQKGDKSLRAFQYNETKTLQWLTLKCKNLCAELKAKNFHIGAKSAYFVKSEKFENESIKNGNTHTAFDD